MKLFVLFLLTSFTINLKAQPPEYQLADRHAEKLGDLSGFNVATIADTITRLLPTKEAKARAIYYWITHNIILDVKATKGFDNRNIDPVIVIKNRKATPLGYATLFQEMCSMANIRCLTVDGFTKNSYEDINNPSDDINHSWNVVQLGQSPTEWFYVDAAKGSGFTDKQMKMFTPAFTSEYFFADKALFNLDHFADNTAWQLGPGPKTKKEFYSLPVISNAAYTFGLNSIKPFTGYNKIKTKNPAAFSFNTSSDQEIATVHLVMGDERRPSKPEPMNFSNGPIAFSYQFKKDDTFPVKVLVNDKVVLEYMFEVSE